MKDLSKKELLEENKLLSDRLQKGDKLFQLLIESSDILFTLHDSEGRYTYFNGASKYSFSDEMVIGKLPSDIFDEIESKKIISGIQKAFDDGKTSSFKSILDMDGKQKIFSEKIYPIYENETVISAAKICIDITEIKEAEKENINIKKRLINITENSSDHIMIVDLDLKIHFINKTVQGLNKEDVIGKSILDFTPKSFHNTVKEKFQFVIQEVKPTSYQTVYQDSNKQKDYFDVRIAPILENNKVISIISSSNNINTQKIAELKLSESEERYRLATNATENGIWDWRIEANEIFYSDQWKAQLGYKPNELKSELNTFENLLHPDCKDRIMQETANFIENPTEYFYGEFRLKHKDGTYRWIHSKAVAVLDEQGVVIRLLGSHSDITERKKHENDILNYQNQLEEIVKERTIELKEKNQTLDESLLVFIGREQKIKKLEAQIQLLNQNHDVN